MLVLSRKNNESINVGDNIKLVVVEIKGDRVRLGIEAPKDIPVHREEIYNRIHDEQAANPVPLDSAEVETPTDGSDQVA